MKFSYPTVGERDLSLSYFPIQGVEGVDRVACILHDITDRKRAEEALLEMNRTLESQGSLLRSREELLKVFVKNVPAAVAMLDRDMRYLQVSDRWCTDYLNGRAQILGCSHYETFPDMPERWKEVHRRALQGETLQADEDRWDGQDGPHWARWEVRPWNTAEGGVGGILILTEDITRRKQMEETLSDMTRKLVESQEQERARIGRELHDDINQRLAMLSIQLEQLQEHPFEVQNRVQELRKETAEIANYVEALSHDLHSSKLEYLGVVAGMKSWCKKFAERKKTEIDFKSAVRNVLPLEVGRSLFRVLQEALHNAQKHSGVRQVEVQLRENSDEIHLLVSDLGKGFDVEAALQGKGLGLASMRERVRLVNGAIAIESKAGGGGTTIHVRVPLRSEHSSPRQAV
jgi:PAS domain S-box-containing protein